MVPGVGKGWIRVRTSATRKTVLSKGRGALVNQSGRSRVDELARRAVRAGIDAIWPPRCVLCGQPNDAAIPSDNLCTGCSAELPTVGAGCAQCANPLPAAVQRCGECLRRQPAFDAAVAALVYRAPVDRLIQRFKFQRDLAAGRSLAACMASRLATEDHRSDDAATVPRPQLLVPVPLHWRRQARRGFNQAERLALDVATRIGGPPVHSLLRRTRATATQSALVAGRRGANVRGAFRCRTMPTGLRHVALVDDVMTTGTTLDECARTLKHAGIERVDVWVAARA